MLFDKLYADLVAPDGSVYVLYLAHLDFGVRLRFAEIEAYPAGAGRQVHAGRAPRNLAACLDCADALDVKLVAPAGRFRFQASALNGAFAPSSSAAPGVAWSVCMARTQARLELPASLGGGCVTGVGYVDRLRVENAGIRRQLLRLDWGRVHLADSTRVWSRVTLRDGDAWQQGARWSRPGAKAEPLPAGRASELVAAEVAGEEAAILGERVLHAGSAVDQDRFPILPLRWLCQVLAGRPEQRRCVARLGQSGSISGSGAGWGVYESVDFA
jgi:hypothetical protein